MKDEKIPGTSNKLGRKHPKLDKLMYRPFKGAHRGFVYELPVIGKRLKEKAIRKAINE